jgi:hypothetical protein
MNNQNNNNKGARLDPPRGGKRASRSGKMSKSAVGTSVAPKSNNGERKHEITAASSHKHAEVGTVCIEQKEGDDDIIQGVNLNPSTKCSASDDAQWQIVTHRRRRRKQGGDKLTKQFAHTAPHTKKSTEASRHNKNGKGVLPRKVVETAGKTKAKAAADKTRASQSAQRAVAAGIASKANNGERKHEITATSSHKHAEVDCLH